MSASLLVLVLVVPAGGPRPGLAAGHDDYWQEIPETGLRFPMVAVPGGTFRMGSPSGERGRRDDEGPRHPVELRPLWIGKYEVTWDEYSLYLRGNDSRTTGRPVLDPRRKVADAVTRPSTPYIDHTYGYGDERYPAFDMSHHAAMTYCEWLSARTGRAYRLPTEAEWEYACRAGSPAPYPFGDTAADLDQYAWYRDNSATDEHPTGSTHPVGKKRPNRWGVHDMLGNVAEWCLDRYDAAFYGSLPPDRTPFGPVNLPGRDRYPHVVRGGSFRSAAADCRSAARVRSDKSWNKADPQEPPSVWWLVPGGRVGFRVVRAVDEYPALVGIKSQVTKESK